MHDPTANIFKQRSYGNLQPKKHIAATASQRGGNRGPADQAMLSANTRDFFGKKVYPTEEEKQPYMKSSINLSQDTSRERIALNAHFDHKRLRAAFHDHHSRKYFLKNDCKIQNQGIKASDVARSYHDQRNVPTYVRRFVEPIHGNTVAHFDENG